MIALGTDTAGSVRIPASMTGSVGLKTTARRWSTVGITPLSRTLDTPGVLARTVPDAAMAFPVIDPLTDDRPLDMVAALAGQDQIGSASGRERVCQYLYISVGASTIKK